MTPQNEIFPNKDILSLSSEKHLLLLLFLFIPHLLFFFFGDWPCVANGNGRRAVIHPRGGMERECFSCRASRKELHCVTFLKKKRIAPCFPYYTHLFGIGFEYISLAPLPQARALQTEKNIFPSKGFGMKTRCLFPLCSISLKILLLSLNSSSAAHTSCRYLHSRTMFLVEGPRSFSRSFPAGALSLLPANSKYSTVLY